MPTMLLRPAVPPGELPLTGSAPALRSAPLQLLLLLAVLGVWGGVVAGGFRFDDLPNIVHDPATAQSAAFLDRLGWGLRPLLRASYYLDHALWGMKAGGFLFSNLLLHSGIVLGVFHLAARRLGDRRAAFAAALVFALQPAHAEAVAYLSGRSILLSSALLVFALAAWERGEPEDAQGRAWRLASLLAFVLAVLARETALIFPVLLALWEGTRQKGARPTRVLAPFVALALALGGLLLVLPRYRELLAYSSELRSPFASLVLNLAALPELLSLWFRPWALSPVHSAPAPGLLQAWAGLALVLVLALSAIRFRKAMPLAALAAAWVLVSLAPTQGLIARRDLISERHLYLAWIGPSLLAGWAWSRLPRERRVRRPLLAGAVLLLAAGGWAANQRAALWRDELGLWSDTVAKAPASALAWNNLGAARKDAGDAPGAAAAFRRALELDPADRTARFNLLALEMLSFRALDDRSPP